jgi:hypothetical protein
VRIDSAAMPDFVETQAPVRAPHQRRIRLYACVQRNVNEENMSRLDRRYPGDNLAGRALGRSRQRRTKSQYGSDRRPPSEDPTEG